MARSLPDGSPNPLYCLHSPRCDHHWHYDFRVNGRRYRNTTETADKNKARDIEAKERSRILDGKHSIRRQPDITFNAFAQEYMRVYATPNKKPSTVSRDWQMLNGQLIPIFGKFLLTEITSFQLEQYKARRLAAKRKPGTVNRELMLMKGILTKAVEWGKLVKSPAVGVKPLANTGQRTRILTRDEQVSLLKAYERGRLKAVRPIIELLLITGARVGEVLALRWEDCTGGYLRFVDTKNGRERRLPITPQIQATLAALPRRHPVFVFMSGRSGTRYKRLLTGFRQALRDAGINPSGIVVHTLRHTALSRMMEAGMDVRTVQEISGHQSFDMLKRYTHPTEQRKAEALNTFGLDTIRSQSPAPDLKIVNK